jgi:hypothetical protein
MMTGRCLAFIAVLAMAASGSSEGSAQGRERAASTQAASSDDPQPLREAKGTVKDVNKDRNQLTLGTSRESSFLLQLDKATTVFVEGRIGALTDIKPGQDVRASYEATQGTNRAQWIEVSKSKPKLVEPR